MRSLSLKSLLSSVIIFGPLLNTNFPCYASNITFELVVSIIAGMNISVLADLAPCGRGQVTYKWKQLRIGSCGRLVGTFLFVLLRTSDGLNCFNWDFFLPWSAPANFNSVKLKFFFFLLAAFEHVCYLTHFVMNSFVMFA